MAIENVKAILRTNPQSIFFVCSLRSHRAVNCDQCLFHGIQEAGGEHDDVCVDAFYDGKSSLWSIYLNVYHYILRSSNLNWNIRSACFTRFYAWLGIFGILFTKVLPIYH